MVGINGALGPLSSQKISEFEKSFDINLPNDYKIFFGRI